MKLLTLLVALLLPTTLVAKTRPGLCERHPIYCQILKNKPDIEKSYAMELSNIIYKLAQVYKIKPYRLAAILAHESGYQLDAVNHDSLDYGISQINHKTIKAYGFDKDRLLTDLEYSVKAGAIVLADIKKMFGNKESTYWCRYNTGTNSFEKIEQKCLNYIAKVEKFL